MAREGRGGRGRGRARGGRGRGRNSNSKNKGSNNKSTTAVIKFFPISTGKQQTMTYETVKDHILQHIQKNYVHGRDIESSLRDSTKMDFSSTGIRPQRAISTESDAIKAKTDQDALDMIYQVEVEEWVKRKNTYESNSAKAYSLIYDNYCSKTIQDKVKNHLDFESDIRDNPIKLLEVIKTLMHDPEDTVYPMASLTEAVRRVINIKQHENESLLDYSTRFKEARDVAKAHLGTHPLDHFVENIPAYHALTDDSAKKEAKDTAYEMWMSYLFVKNSDQAKYGKLVTGFATQLSLGVVQYPKTVKKAIEVLNKYKHDNAGKQKKNNDGTNNNNKDRNRTDNDDNNTTTTVTKTSSEASFAQFGEGLCWCCGKKDHYSTSCPKKDLPKSQWAYKRFAQHLKVVGDDNDHRSIQTSGNHSVATTISEVG